MISAVIVFLVNICMACLIVKHHLDKERYRCNVISRLAKLIVEIEKQDDYLVQYQQIQGYLKKVYTMLKCALFNSNDDYHKLVMLPLYEALSQKNSLSNNILSLMIEISSLENGNPVIPLVGEFFDICGYYWRHEHPVLYYRDIIKKIIKVQIFRYRVKTEKIPVEQRKQVVQYQEKFDKRSWQVSQTFQQAA